MITAVDNSAVILKKIKELPPLPLVIQKLLKVMEDGNSSAVDISNVLSGDQALAAKVLKLVNSSFYGLSGEVSTISRAVVVLGVSAIRNLALGLSVAQIMATGEKGALQKRFWEHSIAAAAAAEILARSTGYRDPEEAFIAGLLHDIGHLIFLAALPKQFLALVDEGPVGQVEREKALLGMGHHQAGQKVLKHWKLPQDLEQATRFHHHLPTITGGEEPLTSLVAMADALASVLGARYESSLPEEDFLKLIEVTGLEVDTLGEILEKVAKRREETRQFLQVAMDGDLNLSNPNKGEHLEVTLLCTDPTKTTWTRQILQHYGHELLPMKEFFGRASAGELPDLVILDPASVTDDQLAKMKPVLGLATGILVLFGNDTDDRVARTLGQTPPRLPIGFSREDLEIGLA